MCCDEERSELDIRVDDEVYWNDPDDGLCSGYATVVEINGDIFRLRTEHGSEIEAFRREIS